MLNKQFLLGAALLFPLTSCVYANSEWTVGGDLRVRNEYFNNSLTLTDSDSGHEQDYFRIRTRVWAKWTPLPSIVLNARVASEPRIWMKSPTISKQHSDDGTEWRYAILDQLNVQWTKDLEDDWSMDIRLGRQDIQFGDSGKWWVIADQSASDGSFTSFFDAVRFTLKNKASKSTFDFIALKSKSDPEANISMIGSANTYSLVEQNEEGIILYATMNPTEDFSYSGYFIYKGDEKVTSSGDDADIYTLGTRIKGSLSESIGYDAEVAFQWGNKEDSAIKTESEVLNRDICAWGANADIYYQFQDVLKNKLSMSFEYLTGDDPDTDDDEMFDILWGRYPRWSDSYAFSYAKETGGRIAQANNLFKIGPTWSFSPTEKLSVSLTYAALWALESIPTRSADSSLFSNDGNFRGNFFQMVLRKQLTDNMFVKFTAEMVTQGDFYTSKDTQDFYRLELSTKF